MLHLAGHPKGGQENGEQDAHARNIARIEYDRAVNSWSPVSVFPTKSEGAIAAGKVGRRRKPECEPTQRAVVTERRGWAPSGMCNISFERAVYGLDQEPHVVYR